MQEEKRMKKESMQKDENAFIWINALVETCLAGIILKLVLGWTDGGVYTAVIAITSFLGAFYGVAIKVNDEKNGKKAKFLNPFRKAIWAELLVMNSVTTIVAVFYACVICNAEWKTVIILAFITTCLTSEIAYGLFPLWRASE